VRNKAEAIKRARKLTHKKLEREALHKLPYLFELLRILAWLVGALIFCLAKP
tara:strand:+ start:811 stop:966 length:156 start_codon:yes stop_codon:yes gene_type:complete